MDSQAPPEEDERRKVLDKFSRSTWVQQGKTRKFLMLRASKLLWFDTEQAASKISNCKQSYTVLGFQAFVDPWNAQMVVLTPPKGGVKGGYKKKKKKKKRTYVFKKTPFLFFFHSILFVPFT